MEKDIHIFWFRRDLRLDDNAGLFAALSAGLPVLPVFIFDTHILSRLVRREDNRVAFIRQEVEAISRGLQKRGFSLFVYHGTPAEAFLTLTSSYRVKGVYCNRDYEPYATVRDTEVEGLLRSRGIMFHTFCDHLIFEPGEVMKEDGTPYTVYTPFSKRWKRLLTAGRLERFPSEGLMDRFLKTEAFRIPTLEELGFSGSAEWAPSRKIPSGILRNYGAVRDFPGVAGTSRLGVHLRFGTVSIRKVAAMALTESEVFLGELIWRDFFASILAHFPYVAEGPFKKRYGFIAWRNKEEEFERWCQGETGYPLVDAGMRELRTTGFMHNRVRMVTASFLSKHLLVDWRWGEAWFASWLLDFDLASNNGNWQWAAGCGCDAAPYFRVFNPETQRVKFDPDGAYVRKWVPEAGSLSYAKPLVDHAFARQRALETYRKALE